MPLDYLPGRGRAEHTLYASPRYVCIFLALAGDSTSSTVPERLPDEPALAAWLAGAAPAGAERLPALAATEQWKSCWNMRLMRPRAERRRHITGAVC